jgi:predicted CopG family antitoxin
MASSRIRAATFYSSKMSRSRRSFFDLIRREALYEERLRKYRDLLKAFQPLQDEEITLTTKLED